MKLAVIVPILAIAACSGCPAPTPPQGPITVVSADGSSVTVSATTACGPISQFCETDEGACISDLNALAPNAPVDLVCMTQATSKLQLTTGNDGGPCAGLGALCN